MSISVSVSVFVLVMVAMFVSRRDLAGLVLLGVERTQTARLIRLKLGAREGGRRPVPTKSEHSLKWHVAHFLLRLSQQKQRARFEMN